MESFIYTYLLSLNPPIFLTCLLACGEKNKLKKFILIYYYYYYIINYNYYYKLKKINWTIKHCIFSLDIDEHIK